MRNAFARVFIILRQPGFAGLVAAALVLGMAFSFVDPFLALWGTKEIGFSTRAFGAFMTAAALSGIVVNTVIARWSDVRVTRKTMLIVGSSGGILGFCGYAFVREPAALIVIAVTAVALAGTSFSQLYAHVRDTFITRSGALPGAGLSMSVVRVCFSFAWTVGPAIGAWLLAGFGFRALFLGASALYLLFLACVLVFVPFHVRTHDRAVATRLPVWRVLARGDILVCFAAFACVFAAHAINIVNLPLTVMTLPGGTERDFGIIFGIGPIVEIPLMLWFGHLAVGGNQLRLIRIGAAVTVFYFLALSLARMPWHLYFAQILSGVSFAILTNVAILFFQEMIPGQAGLATAVFTNAARFGGLVGFITVSASAGSLGHRELFLVCAGLTIMTFVLLLFHRARPASTSDEATLSCERA